MTKKEARRVARSISIPQLSSIQIYDIFNSYIKDGMIVGMYYPMAGEINLLPLIELFPNAKFCFPKADSCGMGFYLLDSTGFKPWIDHTCICNGSYVNKNDIDLIIVPVLAINKEGYRLGHGCGHYDRYLSDYEGNTLSVVGHDSIIDFAKEWHDMKIKVVIEV